MKPLLRVDLDAFAANLARIRTQVEPAQHMLVVKDDAYGHGLEQIVRRAWREGVRWFGAFDVRTGADVRRVAGPEARIFAWIAATDAEVRAALDLDLDIGVGEPTLLDDVARLADGGRARVHLKIDTGLHRNGIRTEDWDAAIRRAAEHEASGAIVVEGIWSHLAEASDDEDDAAAAAFSTAVEAARDAGLTPRIRHLAASAASFERPEFRGDLVRVGAFAYGIRPAGGPGEGDLGIRRIASLVAPVVAVEPAGVRVATGSLHGLPSTLAGRVTVSTPVGPRRLIRVGALESVVESWREALRGDEVVVYGEGAASATDLAEQTDTIGEEIAVRVSPLVERVWL
ncbi:alanine racemase [Microbacterium aoyamense]|uniref:alanine racemase n=1 Tax=Microbacterium aoyamense TaxID=344166 RepID=UPI0020032899|nr:alanine racemase [Microbacterium aoyamense]